ncbi:hypothetical protein [Rhodoplanes sp. SY1]
MRRSAEMASIRVIPGRAEGANPESSGELHGLGWIPGSTLRVAPE